MPGISRYSNEGSGGGPRTMAYMIIHQQLCMQTTYLLYQTFVYLNMHMHLHRQKKILKRKKKEINYTDYS